MLWDVVYSCGLCLVSCMGSMSFELLNMNFDSEIHINIAGVCCLDIHPKCTVKVDDVWATFIFTLLALNLCDNKNVQICTIQVCIYGTKVYNRE